MPETETPEAKAARWLSSIQPYLDELKKLEPNFALVAFARSKNPFLDWVLSGKDPVAFFQPLPPDPEPVVIPWEIESPGIPPPGQPAWFDRPAELLRKIAAKLGIAALLLCVLALPAAAQVSLPFAWDKSSDDTGNVAHPITYKLYSCVDAALTGCTGNDAGTALTLTIPFNVGSQYWVYVTALWDSVEGQPQMGKLESEKSNIVTIKIYPQPAPPGNNRIIVVTVPAIIADNLPLGQSDDTRSFTGTWCLSQTTTGKYGADSLYSCGTGPDTYRWTPNLNMGGKYAVYLRWTAHANRSKTVPVTVGHLGGTAVKTFNEQAGGGVWTLHGTYQFAPGRDGYVEISDANGQACADAVKFEYAESIVAVLP